MTVCAATSHGCPLSAHLSDHIQTFCTSVIIQVDGTERRIWSVWTNFVSKPVAQLLASGMVLRTLPDLLCRFLRSLLEVMQPPLAAGAVGSAQGKRAAFPTGPAGDSPTASIAASSHQIYSTGRIRDNMKFLANTNILIWSYHHCCKKKK